MTEKYKMPLSEPPRKMLANKSNLSVRVPLLHSLLVAAPFVLSQFAFALLSQMDGLLSSVQDGILLLYSFPHWKFFVVVCFIILNPTARGNLESPQWQLRV